MMTLNVITLISFLCIIEEYTTKYSILAGSYQNTIISKLKYFQAAFRENGLF